MTSVRDGRRRRGGWMGCAVACLTTLGLSAAATGQCWQGEFIGDDSEWGDMFAWSLDLSADGDTAVVGAKAHDLPNLSAGAAYIFERFDGVWRQTAKITSPDPAEGQLFGSAVGLHPKRSELCILDSTTGMYIYEKRGSDWTVTQSFTDICSRTGGEAVFSGDGDTLVVTDENGTVFLFDRLGGAWALTDTLVAEGAHRASLSFDGDVVATRGGPTNPWGTSTGVTVHDRRGGTWVTTEIPDSNAGEAYGVCLSADGNRLFLAKVRVGFDSSVVKVYDKAHGSWSHTSTISAGLDVSTRYFGCDIVASEQKSVIAIGSSVSSGAVYIYRFEGDRYAERGRFVPSDAGSVDSLGFDLDLSRDGSTLLAGAPFAYYLQPLTVGSGVAYVMNLNECAPDFASMGDLDGDYDVDANDLGVLLNAYEKTAEGDVDGDDDTDQHDLGILLEHYGAGL